jgi:glycosyltransferase involved in cell wall biosynthesis
MKGRIAVRIAQIAPLHEAVPPKLYGGTERVVSFLTEELVALGHEVTLFASGDSRTAAELVPAWPQALRLDPGIRDTIAPHMLLMDQVRQRAGEFDLIHFHMDYWPFSLFSRQRTPFLTTLHGRLDLSEIRPIFERFPSVPLVSISNDQRRGLPLANFVRTVHHGLPARLLEPQLGIRRDYLAFLGRIAPEKGPERAIRIARAAGIPLRIAAKVSETDRAYFDSIIRPMIAEGGVEMIGEISDAEKPAFLSGAIGLLMPIDWPEPFGLVMIEAMACGTPVIAFNRGSVPEIIEDGTTGLIVANEHEAVLAVSQLPQISRAMVRHRFEQRFTARRMAEDYVDVYRSLIAASTALRESKRAHLKVSPELGPRWGGGAVAGAQRANAVAIPHLPRGASFSPAARSPITSSPLSDALTDAE